MPALGADQRLFPRSPTPRAGESPGTYSATRYSSALTIRRVGLPLALPIVLSSRDAWAAARRPAALSVVARCAASPARGASSRPPSARRCRAALVRQSGLIGGADRGWRWGRRCAMGLVIATAIASVVTLVTASRVIACAGRSPARSASAPPDGDAAAVAAWLR